jgi:hypothetical protein
MESLRFSQSIVMIRQTPGSGDRRLYRAKNGGSANKMQGTVAPLAFSCSLMVFSFGQLPLISEVGNQCMV